MNHVQYRPEIDGLRAIAVAAVVIFHAAPDLLPGGFVGVDVFFVISGYLITSILAAQWHRTGSIGLLDFYARRMRRLLPALLLVLGATVGAAAILLPRLARFQEFADSALASVLFAANLYFDWGAGGYFDSTAERQPLLHLWSLAVEEQFYLFYPLLLMVLLPSRWGRPVFVLGLLSFGSLLLAEYWLGVSPDAAFYQMPARFWELALGGMVALGAAGTLSERRAGVQAIAGLAAIALSACLLERELRFPGLMALPSVAGAAMVLHAVHGSARPDWVGRLLSLRPLVLLGLISYPLYLWHWPILVLDQATRLAPADLGWRLLLCACAVLLAWLTYRFVETPVRRAKAVSAGAVVSRGALASAAMMVGVLWLTTINLGAGDIDRVAKARQDRPADMSRCHFDLGDRIQALAPDTCRSRPSQASKVAIWGDSYALAWKPMAWFLAQRADVGAEAHTMDACPPVPGYRGRMRSAPGFGENCAAFNSLVRRRVESGQFDLVILAARWPAHFGMPLLSESERNRTPPDRADSPSSAEVQAGLRSTLEAASRHARKVLVIGPTPVLRYDAPDCMGTRRLSECARPRAEHDIRVASVQRILRDAAAGLPNVQIIDPTGFFCTPTQCPAVRDGYALFWDDDHVSSTAARAFAREFVATPESFAFGGADPPAPVHR